MRLLIVSLLVAPLALAGCATKKFVNREVGELNTKVEEMETDLEQTQERVERNETRIDAVDKNAQEGIREARGAAQQALTKAQEAEQAAKGKLIYTLTLSNDLVTFPFNRAEISDEAKVIIDDAIKPFKEANRGVYFEIEGHTDSTGEEAYNTTLGEERAMAVRNYLAQQHGIALSRIEVISYGESKPVGDNSTKEGRAQNRRVVLRVLE